jgi:hypothetical protein
MPRKALPAWLTPPGSAPVGDDASTDAIVMEHPAARRRRPRHIGGDDTLSFARILAATGVPLVAIPKTMYNDAPGTEYCIGFSSAITRAKDLIDRQRTTLGSHERIGVFHASAATPASRPCSRRT